MSPKTIAWIAIFFRLMTGTPLAAAEECHPIATLESIQGFAEKQAADQSRWIPVRLGDTFCQRDKLRTSSNSRAAVRLVNNTLVRLRRDSTLSFTDVHTERKSLIELLRGALHMLSRTPHPLEIKTPFVNAAIEGTEFTLTAEDNASEITVFEGKVIASSEQSRLEINPNETGVIRQGVKPVKSLRLHPREAVAWTLYYPAILDCATLDANTCAADSPYTSVMDQLTRNHPERALAALRKTGDASGRFHVVAAGIDLITGNIAEANAHLEAASDDPTFRAAALALKTIIAIAQNNLPRADRQLGAALTSDSRSPLPWLAGSYLHQARFEIPAALAQARKALSLAPRSAIANARVAELLLMSGELDKARQAADRAIRINPLYSHNLVLLGFASLRERSPQSAISAFHQAIELDSGDPLGHFGLGLIDIRQNRMIKGRENLELATLLDPGSALLRSYLGKAYYEENRPKRSAAQYRIAQRLDPNDPTAWFYSAILLHTLNRPVNAWRALEHSIALNGNRGVYRSRMLLDDDEAARSASLGRIYNELGFATLATRQAADALQINPGEYAAHRLLADSYLPFSDLDSARDSELLQAQLLQPLNHFPLQSPLTDTSELFDGAGPTSFAFNEFNPMFIHEGLAAEINAIGGNRGAAGDDLMLSWLTHRFSLAASQAHFENDGARVNQDYRIDSYELFGQGRIGEQTSVQLSLRDDREHKGDVSQTFFEEDRDSDIRVRREIRGARLGLTRRLAGNAQLLVSGIRKVTDEHSSNPIGVETDSGDTLTGTINSNGDATSTMLDLQYQARLPRTSLVAGASYNSRRDERIGAIDFGAAPCPFSSCDVSSNESKQSQRRLYGYLSHAGRNQAKLTFGLAYHNDSRNNAPTRSRHWFPKLGATWRITPKNQLRTALFRSANSVVDASQYQTLEPTQINGFNQIHDEQENAASWNLGLGLKSRITPRLIADIEWLSRDIEYSVDTVVFGNGASNHQVIDVNARDTSEKIFFYWAANDNWSLGLGYLREFDKLDNPPTTTNAASLAPDSALRLETRALPLSLNYFHASGLSARATATRYSQEGVFIGLGDGALPRSGQDSFWTLDASLSWRPKSHH
ncbi:MAG TPA: tetratricopeptide repeat protein, partial [Gammaproteobacteria bacterium]|nr:tetratricopeptide repeat protein [Gammaproteobacteria bacterium]